MLDGIRDGLVVHIVVRLNERVAAVSVDMNTPLKVRVLKHLDDRYTSFWTKREAFPQKADYLEAVVRDDMRCYPRRTSSLALWNIVLKSLPFLNGRASMYSRDLGGEMA